MLIGGNIVGKRLAIIDFPAPGGPIRIRIGYNIVASNLLVLNYCISDI
jgi:hypothetical protein